MKRATLPLALVIAAVWLATITPASAGLKPAGEARADAAAKAARDVPLGERAKVRIGPGEPKTTVVVTGPVRVALASADRPRTLQVHVRVENPGKKPAEVPNLGVVCKGAEGETPHYVESAMSAGEDLPPGTFLEGDYVSDYPEGCAKPTFRFFPFIVIDGVKSGAVEYPLGLP